jgi:hypothetical protein
MSMRGTKLAVLAGSVLVTGVCGCSLPQVLPLQGGTSQGPSPYGVWYEQHWATNAVLLAAADQPEGEFTDVDGEFDETSSDLQDDLSAEAADAPVEAAAAIDEAPEEFDASTPYQFPASSFAPPASEQPSVEELTPPASPGGRSSGPIRY